jgi:hypothetical protein
MIDIFAAITAISSAVTSGGVIALFLQAKAAHQQITVTVRQTEADHKRRMQEFAVKLVLDWNQNTLIHRRALEKAIPGLIDNRTDRRVAELTWEKASAIYHSSPQDGDQWELRFNIIQLFNFFEAVAVASETGVADREVIRRSFEGTLTKYAGALSQFVSVVSEARGYPPWAPVQVLLNRWKDLPPIPNPPGLPERR